jgi:flagellar motor protein MotB
MRFALLAAFHLIACSSVNSQVFNVINEHKAEVLVNNHFISKNHSGIKIRNIHYTGMRNAIGYFNYKSKFSDLPPNGIILSTGKARDAMGPNNSTASTENHSNGDADLSGITKSKSFDASVIEFDFMSLTDSINFVFQFASEEYPEYVDKGVSDIFGFFISDFESNTKQNIAVLPNTNTPITIDLINEKTNSKYFVANYPTYSESRHYYETSNLFMFDGFTKPIQTGLKLKPYNWYHFRIVITDIGDRKFDSWIFLKGNSFVSNGEMIKPDSLNLTEYFKYSKDSLIITNVENKLILETPIYFEFDSYELNNSSLNCLNSIKDILEFSNYKVDIIGYTDKSGSTNYNQVLSDKRAAKVEKYFIESGIDNNRIKSYGKGELQQNNESEKSRKVEFVFY